MLKGLFVVTLMGFGVTTATTHEYIVKEIPNDMVGTFCTPVVYQVNDTICEFDKTFVVLEIIN